MFRASADTQARPARANMPVITHPLDRRTPMKRWIKRTLLATVGAAVVLGGLVACGHRPHGPMSDAQITEWRGKAVDRISSKLDLDAAQKAKLAVLADELIAQRTALRAGADPKTELQALIAGPQFDRARGQALLDQKLGSVKDNGPKVIAAMADFYDSLKPEQQAKARDFMAHARQHWGGGRG